MVPILILLVLIVGVGISVIAVRNRSEHGIESGISSFRREMRALAPQSGDRDPDRFARDHDPADDEPPSHVEQDPGVHLLDERPEVAPPPTKPAASVEDPFGVAEPADDEVDGDGGGG